MVRVYVAGPYSGNTLQTLNNMRVGMRKATELMLKGFAPFCPWLDHHFMFMLRENENLTVEDYYAYSLAFMEVCDAVLLVPNWENSKGTLKEIEVAEKLGIPVFKPEEEDAMYDYFKLGTLNKSLEDYLEEDNV